MKKQKLTATEKRILKNGPCFDQLLCEVMFYEQVCAGMAMSIISSFLLYQLAEIDKPKTLDLLERLTVELSKRKPSTKRRARKLK